MVAQSKTRVTFADYAAMPETNQIVELIDGEIVVNPPRDKHQKALWQMVATLTPLMTKGEARFAPTALHFDDGNSFEPDLFWISPDNHNCVLEENGRYWHGAPDLVVEILSPSTASDDRGIKFETYQKYGVREYWLVDPDAKYIEVYRYEGGKFERQGVFKPHQPFVSAVLGGATIDSHTWYGEPQA
jgi:Uma2 family endonuclease